MSVKDIEHFRDLMGACIQLPEGSFPTLHELIVLDAGHKRDIGQRQFRILQYYAAGPHVAEALTKCLLT